MQARSSRRAFRTLLCTGLSLLLVSAFMLVAGTGCSDSQDETTQPVTHASRTTKHDSDNPLRVGVQYNVLSIPTVFADDQGYFSEAGLNVELYTFANGAEENKIIEAGGVDIASDGLASVYMLATGLFSWIGESDNGSATVAVYVREGSAPTQVSGAVPANPGVKGSADTLRGLTVVGPAGTMEEWVAVSFFSQFGLSAGTDFDFIEMDRSQAAESVIEGESDIFVATDADYCRMMEENGMVALATGAAATWVPFNNGYLVNNTVLEERYDDVVAFLKAVYRAAETLNSNPDLRNDFAYEYYRANGKPTTRVDVQRETEMRPFLVPSDFTAPDYRLGSGILDIGWFNASIGALKDNQEIAIENSIDPKVLNDAFGIDVKAGMLGDGLQAAL